VGPHLGGGTPGRSPSTRWYWETSPAVQPQGVTSCSSQRVHGRGTILTAVNVPGPLGQVPRPVTMTPFPKYVAIASVPNRSTRTPATSMSVPVNLPAVPVTKNWVPRSKLSLNTHSATGGVAVAVGVIGGGGTVVGVLVAVGGTGVLVAVGGTGVLVAVGGTGVLVGVAVADLQAIVT